MTSKNRLIHYALPAYAIAKNTFREALRNKILGAFVFVAAFVIGTGLILSQMSLHEERRVVTDFSYASNSIISMMMAIFVSVSLVSAEKKERTIYTILSKPIARPLFILGKYFGVLFLIATNILLLFIISSGLLYAFDAPMESAWLWSPVTIFCQVMIVTAISIMFSTLARPLLSGILTGITVVIGHLQSQMTKLIDSGFLGDFSVVFRYIQRIMPNFEALNISTELTHVVPIPTQYVLTSIWYALSIVVISLVIASVRFSREEF